ncbi:MAG: HAD-IIA family hydrolase [Actinomycetaceae bacterium]|nr:HAD-IIA family hydrolase [Actinomycetaceae bacterium]
MANGKQAKICELYDVGLFDLDGVLYRGNEPVPYASQSLARIRRGNFAAVFVTNNASRVPEVVAQQLVSLGVDASPDDILSSAHIGVSLAQSLCGKNAKVLLCGAQGLYRAASEAGLTIVDSADDNPQAVIHGFSPEANWEMLSEAVLAIGKGACYIATNLDRFIPRERGLMLGVGSFAAAITHATGVTPISGAKPEPQMFRHAAEKAHAHAPLVIGDNLETDIRGGYASGFPTLHVLTGGHTPRDVICAPVPERPRYLADDLRCLDEHYPDIELVDDGGNVRATISASDTHIDHEAFASQAAQGNFFAVRIGKDLASYDNNAVTIGHTTYPLDKENAHGIELTVNEYRAFVHALWLVLDTNPSSRQTIERYLPDVKVRHHD